MATKTKLPSKLPTPISVAVGATDLVVEHLRGYVAEVSAKVADVQKEASDPQALGQHAAAFVGGQIEAVSKDAKARRAAIEARVAELQKEAKAAPGRVQALVDDNVSALTGALTGAYDDLAKRGDHLYSRIRRQQSTQDAAAAAETTVVKAKTTRTQATGAAEKQVEDSKESATAAKKTAKKAARPSTAAKKKATAAKRSAKATTTAAKKTAASATQAAKEAAEKVGD